MRSFGVGGSRMSLHAGHSHAGATCEAHGHGGHSHGGSSQDGHSHSHAPSEFGRAFAIATTLNLALVALQVIYGLAANSIALLADAGHNFGDAVGLIIAWGAHGLSGRGPTRRFTYGFGSA